MTGTVSASNGARFIFATITEPKGSIEDCFDGFEDPVVPTLQVALRPGSADLRLVIERRKTHGTSYDHVRLF